MARNAQSVDEIEELYRRYGGALLLFAASISRDHGYGQDVLHHVFLRLMETGKLSRVVDKKAYLFACVRNAIRTQVKRQNRNAPLDTDSIWFSPPDRDYAAEQNLRNALKALPEDQREVIVLHVWGELTFAQVAEVLGVSPNTAASRYRYALARLRTSMFSKEDSCANFRG